MATATVFEQTSDARAINSAMTRPQLQRALDFVQEHWPKDEIAWLRQLPPAEARVICTLALMGAVPVDIDFPDSDEPVLVLGAEPVLA